MLYLHPDLLPFFSKDTCLFSQCMNLSGEIFRQQKGRLTLRIRLGEKSYFIKQHHGVGYREIIKNISQFRFPVCSALPEVKAIHLLEAFSILMPKVLGYGIKGINPATQRSFILLEDLSPAISLETLSAHELRHHSGLKQALIKKVAEITRCLHEAGFYHRDLYICHFLLKEEILYLIDLHRASQSKLFNSRLQIKDLAALYFSTKEMGLTKQDLHYFLKVYTRGKLVLTKRQYRKILQRGERLYREHQG